MTKQFTGSGARWASGVAAAVTLCGAALGHDLFEPPFRGQPGATVSHWEFNDPNFSAPDGCVPEVNPNGGASAATNGMHLDTFAGLAGVVCLDIGQQITHDILNNDDPNKAKEIWVQATFHRHGIAGGGLSDLDCQIAPFGGPPAFVNDVPVPGMGGAWVHRTWIFLLPICPPREQVVFTALGGHVDVDQVVVDTVCLPEGTFIIPTPAAPDDFDGDGLPDDMDPCPYDLINIDTDGDGIGDECECECPADLDGDGDVDFDDLLIVLGNFGGGPAGDVDQDGDVDLDDLLFVLGKLGTLCP